MYALAPKADGGLLAGGAFDDIAGDERLTLAAISPDGSVARAVADIESPGAVFALTAQPDGGTIVGGAFHRVGSVPRRNILRLDTQGLLDPLWNPGVDFQPWSLAVHGDETVYAAGVGFYASDGSQTFAIRKMSGFGTGDVDTGWSVAPDGWVDAMLVADGSLFVGGAFETIGGAAIPRLARLSETTALADPTWDAGVACCAVHALALGDDATLYVGGDFARIGDEARRSLARISIDSAVADRLWDPSPDGYVYALARAGDGAIYAGGQFLFIGGDYRHLLAKLSPTGVGAIDGQWQANLGGLGSDPPIFFDTRGRWPSTRTARCMRPDGSTSTTT